MKSIHQLTNHTSIEISALLTGAKTIKGLPITSIDSGIVYLRTKKRYAASHIQIEILTSFFFQKYEALSKERSEHNKSST